MHISHHISITTVPFICSERAFLEQPFWYETCTLYCLCVYLYMTIGELNTVQMKVCYIFVCPSKNIGDKNHLQHGIYSIGLYSHQNTIL